MVAGILRSCPLGEQCGAVLSPQAGRDLGRWGCGRFIPLSGLATAVCSVLQGMPQGSWVHSSCHQALAHLPGLQWLSRADINLLSEGA